MALIKCPDCGTEVSDSAAACPKCACPISARLPAPAADPAYVPVVPPREILIGNVIASVALVAVCAWLILVVIPEHDPGDMSAGDVARSVLGAGKRYLSRDLVLPAKIAAGFLGLLGMLSIATGSYREIGRLVDCKKCGKRVVARRGSLGQFACELCGTTAATSSAPLRVLVMVFLVIGVAVVAAVKLSQRSPQEERELRDAQERVDDAEKRLKEMKPFKKK